MRRNKKKTNRPNTVFFVLLLLCALAIGMGLFRDFTGGTGFQVANYIMAPMQKGIGSVGRLAAGTSRRNKTISELEEENNQLREQIDQMKSQINSLEQNLTDYNDLLDLFQLSEKYSGYEMTGARIISKDPGNWYNRFTINKGSRNGILPGMNVVSDNGLVGIVVSTSPSTSVVRSIIDDNSSVSGMLSKNYNTCIVSGDLTLIDSNLMDVELLSDSTSIADGDEVVTSYISDKFLPGILIGYISKVNDTEADLSRHAQLTPAVDFEHLSNVLIIKQLQADPDQKEVQTQSQDSAPAETESSANETEPQTTESSETEEAGE